MRFASKSWRSVVVAAVAVTLAAGFGACKSGEMQAPEDAPALDSAQRPNSSPVPASEVATARAGPEPRAAEPTPGTRPPAPVSRGMPPPEVTARAVLVVDPASGVALHEANARERLAPASLTKIATAAVVLERGPALDVAVEVNPDLVRQWLEDSSTMGLLPGDRFSVRDLLYGLLMVSGNDAARELAIATAGSEADFVDEMNELAQRLGLRDTRFTDVHGLGGPGHYSSAWDLAILSAHAMTLPAFRALVGTEMRVVSGSQDLSLYNHNPLLNYTPGVDGIKVGYTEEAGATFVASVERDGRRLLIVLLNAPGMAFDAIALIEWAYANHEWR